MTKNPGPGKKGHTLGHMSAHLAPTLRVGRDDIIWAAGIFEGDGYSQHSARTEKAGVTQVDAWLPTRLRSLFGGSVRQRKQQKPRWKPPYEWTVTGARARGFLQSIYGLLSPRRQEQVRNALGVNR